VRRGAARGWRGLLLRLAVGVTAALVAYAALEWSGLRLTVDLQSSRHAPSDAQVYWAAEGGAFRVENSVEFSVQPGRAQYGVLIPAGLRRLRLDPLSHSGKLSIHALTLGTCGVTLRRWGGGVPFQGWVPGHHLAPLPEPTGVMELTSTGTDPYLVLDEALDLTGLARRVHALAASIMGLAAGLASWLLPRVVRRLSAIEAVRKRRATVTRALRGARDLALIAGLGLALSEVAFRVYARFNPVFLFDVAGYNRFRGVPRGADYGFTLNSGGFKDVEFPRRKRPGTKRVLALGDSFTFGVVPYRKNFLTRLEAEMQAEGSTVEILNMGIPGTGPYDYLALLLDEGLPLDPDGVLVHVFIGNDLTDRSGQPASGSYLLGFGRYLLALSRARRQPGTFAHGAVGYDDSRGPFDDATYLELEVSRGRIFRKSFEDLPRLLDRAVAALAAIQEACRRRGLRLLVVTIPGELQVSPGLQAAVLRDSEWPPDGMDWEAPNRALNTRLAELGIESLDLLAPFAEASASERLYRPNDDHWNLAGNALAARLLRAELGRRWPDWVGGR